MAGGSAAGQLGFLTRSAARRTFTGWFSASVGKEASSTATSHAEGGYTQPSKQLRQAGVQAEGVRTGERVIGRAAACWLEGGRAGEQAG